MTWKGDEADARSMPCQFATTTHRSVVPTKNVSHDGVLV